MNPELPQNDRDELEASLTALLLGELPGEKAAALRQAIAQDADLSKLHERLKLTMALVSETAAKPSEQTVSEPRLLKLSHKRRQKLLRHFKTVTPKEFARSKPRGSSWFVPVGIAAVLVAIMGAMFLPTFRSTS